MLVAYLSYRAYVHMVERRPVTELSGPGAPKELGIGMLVGAALVAATVASLWLPGYYRVAGTNGWNLVLPLLANDGAGAFVEEIILRGIVFRITEERLGTWLALATSALLFALLHLASPDATSTSAIVAGLEGGILLSAAYVLTRRLWLPVGIHFAWDFSQDAVASVNGAGAGKPHWPVVLVRGRLRGRGFDPCATALLDRQRVPSASGYTEGTYRATLPGDRRTRRFSIAIRRVPDGLERSPSPPKRQHCLPRSFQIVEQRERGQRDLEVNLGDSGLAHRVVVRERHPRHPRRGYAFLHRERHRRYSTALDLLADQPHGPVAQGSGRRQEDRVHPVADELPGYLRRGLLDQGTGVVDRAHEAEVPMIELPQNTFPLQLTEGP